MDNIIRANDVVKHKPSGETWVVCGVDYDAGELIPCGYPFPSLAKIADCEKLEDGYTAHGQPENFIKALRDHELYRFWDARSACYYGYI